MYETLLINGVDVLTLVDCVESIDGLYNIGTTRGDNIVFPGVDGETYVDKPFGTGLIELGFFLSGSTQTEFNDRLRALRTLVQPGRLLSIQRKLSYTAGNETQHAMGEYVSGLNPTLQVLRFGKTTLGLKIHDGLWYGPSQSATVTSGGTVTAAGEARTHAMTITMPPGASITNTTTDHTVSNTLAAGSGGNVIVDVQQMTATQDGVDVSNALVWNRRLPMRLVPGSNAFTGTSGATLDYFPAYL